MINPADPKQLILGPFQGHVACQTIAFGKGVCGAAAASLKTQLVEDVNEFPGHIACDAASKSEIVVPIVQDGKACTLSKHQADGRWTDSLCRSRQSSISIVRT